MDMSDLSGWLAGFERQIRNEGFVTAWVDRWQEAVELRSRHIFNLKGAAFLHYLRHDPELARHFDQLSPADRDLLEKSLRPPAGTGCLTAGFGRWFKKQGPAFRPHPEVRESDGSGVLYHRLPFKNWGRTVKNTPALTFIPRTRAGVCNIVRWARDNGKRVRGAGYRHTWGDLFAENDQVLISSLPLDDVEQLPAPEPAIDPANELQGISLVGATADGKALCKIGAATTNEQFRRWCLDTGGGNWHWTIPLNVIMVEITWGGSNAPICHGAGIRHKTLSDLVTEVEFVNANGELQTVNDPVQLKAAAGCFGLLGYVTSITLLLDPMSFATMKPLKKRVALTIPPPAGLALPPDIDLSGITPADLDAAWRDFTARCEKDYYAEWFWFPYQKECWINTWQNDGSRADARDYPGDLWSFVEEAEEYLAELANDTVFRLLPGRWQAELTARLAMSLMPSGVTIVAPLIDALHFRRGIQNMRVLDMELEIPLPPSAEDPTRPDWSVCQKAWWWVIANLYQRKDAPLRVALEMRVMGGSDVIMAPQYGNRWGTCSIEVLTTPDTDAAEWQAYMQEVADAWMAIKAPDGSRLNVRPHWAKMWQGLTFSGQPALDYLKNEAYKDQLPAFRSALQQVALAGGYTLKDCRSRFSNAVFDRVFEQIFD